MKDSLTYYATGEETFRNGESIFVNKAFEQVEPHLHAHSFIEISYVVSGTGLHRVGDKEYTVSKGNLFIINYDIPHEFRSLPGNNQDVLTIYNCAFAPEFLDHSLIGSKDFSSITNHLLFKSLFPDELENPVDINLLEEDNREIASIYDKMYREYQLMNPGYIELLRAYLTELLIIVFRLYRNINSSYTSNSLEKNRNQLIENVINYLRTNYASEIKLEELSLMAFISKNHFCKIFKKSTGMTVLEYTQKARIEEACKLLKTTDKKIIEIASLVGYSNLKYFNEVFKRHIGNTPGEYRKNR
ncbi:MAG: transcriptional regulator, AraC family [Oscillospiraceae bacterium]|nr:transcriptional regulator, AraC family [Oscillospiraceae bacterium]